MTQVNQTKSCEKESEDSVNLITIKRPRDDFTEEEIQIIRSINLLSAELSKIGSIRKRAKIKKVTSLVFIPAAYPFSDFDIDDKPEQFGDNCRSEIKMLSKISTNISIIKILNNLEDRNKIVFMFLLLRESGFSLTHEECAKILSISRQSYMKLVKSVKTKAKKLLKPGLIYT